MTAAARVRDSSGVVSVVDVTAGRRIEAEAVEVARLGPAILDENIIIFRGAFGADDMLALRRLAVDWAAVTAPFPAGRSASLPGINFHRRDDRSTPSSIPHIFHQFGFGAPALLPSPLKERVERISALLLDLQNRLAGTSFPPGCPEFRTKVIRHPRGGGHLVPHRHPFLPQKISLFLNLSQPGSDYASGGARFRCHGQWIDTSWAFRIGDVLAWRYDLIHAVAPVDGAAELSWEGDDGFWIYAVEYNEAHPNSSEAEW